MGSDRVFCAFRVSHQWTIEEKHVFTLSHWLNSFTSPYLNCQSRIITFTIFQFCEACQWAMSMSKHAQQRSPHTGSYKWNAAINHVMNTPLIFWNSICLQSLKNVLTINAICSSEALITMMDYHYHHFVTVSLSYSSHIQLLQIKVNEGCWVSFCSYRNCRLCLRLTLPDPRGNTFWSQNRFSQQRLTSAAVSYATLTGIVKQSVNYF